EGEMTRANLLDRLGRCPEAVTAFDHAIAQYRAAVPDRVDWVQAVGNQASCLRALGRADDAVTRAEAALAVLDRHPWTPIAAAETDVRAKLAAGDAKGATTVALETYGPELYGFLHALARDDDLAAEAFATFSEDLWKGLVKFRWESSLRTWAYALARNALWRL